jgi:hypothetical protein
MVLALGAVLALLWLLLIASVWLRPDPHHAFSFTLLERASARVRELPHS